MLTAGRQLHGPIQGSKGPAGMHKEQALSRCARRGTYLARCWQARSQRVSAGPSVRWRLSHRRVVLHLLKDRGHRGGQAHKHHACSREYDAGSLPGEVLASPLSACASRPVCALTSEPRLIRAWEAVRRRRPSIFAERVRTAGLWLARCQSKGSPCGFGSSCTCSG